MLNLDASLVYRIPALLFTITVHEYAHGAMSASLGDPTPEGDGRLTMNPLAHLDLIGSLMLILVGFGWARPVRVDPRYYANPRKGMLQVAFAGPASNLLVTFLAMFLQLFLARYFNAGRGGFNVTSASKTNGLPFSICCPFRPWMGTMCCGPGCPWTRAWPMNGWWGPTAICC